MSYYVDVYEYLEVKEGTIMQKLTHSYIDIFFLSILLSRSCCKKVFRFPFSMLKYINVCSYSEVRKGKILQENYASFLFSVLDSRFIS